MISENILCVYYHVGLVLYTGAPFSIHSIPPFKIHPTAMKRMLFDFFYVFSSIVSKMSLLFQNRL